MEFILNNWEGEIADYMSYEQMEGEAQYSKRYCEIKISVCIVQFISGV